MNALKNSKNMTIVGAVVIVALALLFWTQLLSPKREEAVKLGGQIETVETSLASHRVEVEEAEAARRRFPAQYQRLVVLGKAVPGGDETASLLVQLNGLADRAGVRFNDLELNSEGAGGSAEEAAAPPSSPGGTPVSATEVAASLLPLGASIGPAGLAVMPYTLTFEGDFFEIADFIERLDKMVKTQNEKVLVDGRLITVDGFSLSPEGEGEGSAPSSGGGSPSLTASFEVTTYLTPPSQGTTAGATPSSPAASSATPAATTTGGAP
jgi:hypothetical protein